MFICLHFVGVYTRDRPMLIFFNTAGIYVYFFTLCMRVYYSWASVYLICLCFINFYTIDRPICSIRLCFVNDYDIYRPIRSISLYFVNVYNINRPIFYLFILCKRL